MTLRRDVSSAPFGPHSAECSQTRSHALAAFLLMLALTLHPSPDYGIVSFNPIMRGRQLMQGRNQDVPTINMWFFCLPASLNSLTAIQSSPRHHSSPSSTCSALWVRLLGV